MFAEAMESGIMDVIESVKPSLALACQEHPFTVSVVVHPDLDSMPKGTKSFARAITKLMEEELG